MKAYALVAAAVLAFGSAGVRGQATRPVSPEEAARRMQERQAVAGSTGVVQALRQRIAQLERENAALRARLGGMLPTAPAVAPEAPAAAAPAARAAPYRPPSTFTERARKGGSREQIAAATKIDARVKAYLAAKPQPPEVADALYAGKPVVGMPEDALPVIGRVVIESESSGSRDVSWIVNEYGPAHPSGIPIHQLTIRDGKVDFFRTIFR